MPQNYTGTQQNISGRPNLTISEMIGSDIRDSISVRTPLRTLADFLHTLLKKAGILDIVSTWTAKQTFQAGAASGTAPAAGSTDLVRQTDMETTVGAVSSALSQHANQGTAHFSTPLNSGSAIVQRDANGRFACSDPVADNQADTRGARNTAIGQAVDTVGKMTPDLLRVALDGSLLRQDGRGGWAVSRTGVGTYEITHPTLRPRYAMATNADEYTGGYDLPPTVFIPEPSHLAVIVYTHLGSSSALSARANRDFFVAIWP